MRQVVSVVKDGVARYLIAEDGELTQFAQVVVPDAFDAGDTAKLGLDLIERIGLNGHKRRQVIPAPRPELPPAPVSERRPKGPKRYHRVTREQVIEYIIKHPGCRARDIADALTPNVPKDLARHTVSNRLISIEHRSKLTGEPAPVRKVKEGPQLTRWYPAD